MSTHDRLQPALLDRLRDDFRSARVDGIEQVVMSRQQLRAAVLRDLSWLLNAVQPLRGLAPAHRLVADSVLNFGLPPVSGVLASRLDVDLLERNIAEAIRRFEPRILPETLTVVAVQEKDAIESHNVVQFEIRGTLWAQPVPIELLLRTEFDLEAGHILLRDASGAIVAR